MNTARKHPKEQRNSTTMRAGPATAPLIKQHHPIGRRIKITPHCRAAAAAGTAVQNQHRDAIWIAALFDINAVAIAHIHDALIERIDRRVKKINCALLA